MPRKTKPPLNQSQAGISFDGIAWEISPWGTHKFVGSVQGDGGKDWGWTHNRAEAKPLTPYWQRRYRTDRRACGIPFQQQPIPADEIRTPPATTCIEHAYGTTQRLSFQIKVF